MKNKRRLSFHLRRRLLSDRTEPCGSSPAGKGDFREAGQHPPLNLVSARVFQGGEGSGCSHGNGPGGNTRRKTLPIYLVSRRTRRPTAVWFWFSHMYHSGFSLFVPGFLNRNLLSVLQEKRGPRLSGAPWWLQMAHAAFLQVGHYLCLLLGF